MTIPIRPSEATLIEVRQALQRIELFRRQITHEATVDPGITDDAAAGYPAGSMWNNTANETTWRSMVDTEGAATWNRIMIGGATSTGGVAGGTTDDTLARWDGTTGAKLQSSGIVLNDDDSLGAVLVQATEPTNPVKGSLWFDNS